MPEYNHNFAKEAKIIPNSSAIHLNTPLCSVHMNRRPFITITGTIGSLSGKPPYKRLLEKIRKFFRSTETVSIALEPH